MLFCLDAIFDVLDIDCDGQLYSSDFKSHLLPKEIIAIFFPIAIELEVQQKPCTKEYFFQSGLELLKKINLNDKEKLLNLFKSKPSPSPQEYSFCVFSLIT